MKYIDRLTKRQKVGAVLICLAAGSIALAIWAPMPHMAQPPFPVPEPPVPATPAEELAELHAFDNFMAAHGVAIFWWGCFLAVCAFQGFLQIVETAGSA